MNDELIQDLKQLIDASNSQSEQRMMGYMDKRFEEVDRKFEQIDQRFEDVVDGMNQQTETIIEHFDRASATTKAKIDDHEERISRLERHAA